MASFIVGEHSVDKGGDSEGGSGDRRGPTDESSPRSASPKALPPADSPDPQWFWPVCLTLGLVTRLITVVPVLFSGDVRPIGTDALYHLHRIHQTVLQYPTLPTSDPYLSYPEGAVIPYEPGFDFFLATFVRALSFSAAPSWSTVAALCSVAMPFLGLLVIPLYARIAGILAGNAAKRTTAILLAVLPGVTFTSLTGQVDHHVLEPLIIGLPLVLFLNALPSKDLQSGDADTYRGIPLLWVGLSLGLGIFFWRGTLLPAGILALYVGIRATFLASNGTMDRLTRDGAPLMMLAAAVASIPAAALSAAPSPLTYFMVSWLQPIALGILALGMYGMGLLAVQLAMQVVMAQRRHIDDLIEHAGKSHAKGMTTLPPLPLFARRRIMLLRLLMLGTVGSAPLLFTALFWPDFGMNLSAGLGFLSRADLFVQSVGEQRPLFSDDTGHFSLHYLLFFYGAFALLAPLIVRFAWREGEHRRELQPEFLYIPDSRWTLFIVWSGVTCLLALLQRRYAAHFAPIYCVWLGLAIRHGAQLLAPQGALIRVMGSAFMSILSLPTAFVTGAMAVIPTQPAALIEASRWLQQNTPETSGFGQASPEVPPEYGVLAAWDEGHHLLALAHRPNVGNPFGIEWFMPGIQRTARFWLAPAETLAQTMDDTRARYALLSFRMGLLADEARFLGLNPADYVMESDLGTHPGPLFWTLGVTQLYFQSLLPELPRSADAEPPPSDWSTKEAVPGVRIVWEGGQLDAEDAAVAWVGADAPAYQIIERVPGARIQGRLSVPASVPTAVSALQIRATQTLISPQGRRFTWQITRPVRLDGYFEIPAVYPHSGLKTLQHVRTEGPLRLNAGAFSAEIRVDEAQIQTHEIITLDPTEVGTVE